MIAILLLYPVVLDGKIPKISADGEAQATAETLRKHAAPGAADEEVDEDDEEGQDLFYCISNLVYGARSC